MIKAVFFDIDNVLYNSGHQVEMARRAAIEAMVAAGLGTSVEEAYNKLEGIVKTYGSNFNKHYDTLVGDHKNKYKIIASGIVAYHNTKRAYLKPYDDTHPTIDALNNAGYRLGVVSDGLSIKQWEKLVRLGLSDSFDTVVVSEEVGATKPDPKIFEAGCERIGVESEYCMFIGDRLDADIAGANKVGMTSVRLLRGKYKDQKPQGLQEQADFEVRGLGEILNILKRA